MEENKIMNTTETGGKPAVWESASFFLKLVLIFAAFYVFCLYRNPMGITYPLFTAGLLGVYLYLLKKEHQPLKKISVFYMAAIFLLGLSNCLTDNLMIIMFNKLGSFLLYGILFVHNSCRDQNWSFLKYTGSLLEFGLSLIENLPAVFREGRRLGAEKKTGREKRAGNSKAVYVLLGILIALLLLCLILPLLASADQTFENLMDRFFDRIFLQITVPEQAVQIVLMFCWGVIFFAALLTAVRQKKIREESKDLRNLEPVTAITTLSVIGIVYLIFCLIQISYLFTGGLTLPSDYTYSGFAREGFFQLLFVSMLNLTIVLFCIELFRKSRILQILLTFLCGCTYIMVISSVCRMYLYVDAYGLTRLRILVLAALLVIAVVLGGMICSIYREHFPLFTFSAVAVTAVYLVLSFSHMDALIAEYNISQRGLDITAENQYLMTLSADAAGVYEKALEKNVKKTELADEMLDNYFEQLEQYETQGIRRFNLSRYLGSRAAQRYHQAAGEQDELPSEFQND